MITLRQLRDKLNSLNEHQIEAVLENVWKNEGRWVFESRQITDERSTEDYNKEFLNKDILEVVPTRAFTLLVGINVSDDVLTKYNKSKAR